MQHSKPEPDIEIGRLRDGYPSLARWIAQDLDDDPLVFRRFGRHGARVLLHLQCRLTALEKEIDDLDEQTRTAEDLDTRRSLQRWEKMMMSAKERDTSLEHRLVEKLNEFQGCLKEYYELLTCRSHIARLSRPEPRVTEAYKGFMIGAALGATEEHPRSIVSGIGSGFLSDVGDLISLQKPPDDDLLSRYLQKHWLFRRRHNSDLLDGTTRYKSSHIAWTLAIVVIVLAAILFVGAVVSLYFVAQPKAKLALVAVYTLIFAISVASCTNAQKAEVFATTPAYAAVLVVFVSGDLGGTKTEQCLIQLDGGIFKVVNCPS